MSGVRGAGIDRAAYGVAMEPSDRRVRVVFNGEVVADTTRAVLLYETAHIPLYYLPIADVRAEFLVPTDHATTCPWKGQARYWSLRVGDRVSENAAWNYPDPIESCPPVAPYLTFYWDRVDAWFEEDEQIHVHPRDPYHRVDVIASSRHVIVEFEGVRLAESRRPQLLFESDLPARFYLPRLDVDLSRLVESATGTACPYKGEASYWSAAGLAGGDDIAWTYRYPIPPAAPIAGHLAFFNERVDLTVDGILLDRPRTRWSPRPARVPGPT